MQKLFKGIKHFKGKNIRIVSNVSFLAINEVLI